jgi:hypothetical protein
MIIANQRSNDRCQPATMLVTQRCNWVRSCTAQRKPVQIPFNDPYLEQDAAEREPINLYQKPLAQRGRRERLGIDVQSTTVAWKCFNTLT